MRRIFALVLASAATLGAPAAASAELRTGSHGNPYPHDPPSASPTRPRFKSTSIRFDTTAGSLVVTIRFTTKLADPSTTSALRPWSYSVTLGHYFSSICEGGERTWLEIDGRLGTDAPAVLRNVVDIDNRRPDLPVAAGFSSDRRELTLSVTSPRLVGLNLICSDVAVEKDDDERFKYASGSFGFLFDGFDRLDGALGREAAFSMRDNIEFLDRDWGRPPTKPRRRLALQIRCHRTLLRDTVVCRASGMLRSVRGKPRLRLHGRLVFPRPFRSGFIDGPKWRYHLNGTVGWQRCPAYLKPAKRLLGKPCHLTIRWRGTHNLSAAVLG